MKHHSELCKYMAWINNTVSSYFIADANQSTFGVDEDDVRSFSDWPVQTARILWLIVGRPNRFGVDFLGQAVLR